MAIAGRTVRERERMIGMTDEERAWRKKWVKDQVLTDREPVYVQEYWDSIRNPIRRLYTRPLNTLYYALQPIIVSKIIGSFVSILCYYVTRIQRIDFLKVQT